MTCILNGFPTAHGRPEGHAECVHALLAADEFHWHGFALELTWTLCRHEIIGARVSCPDSELRAVINGAELLHANTIELTRYEQEIA